jgi:hypothetical protein
MVSFDSAAVYADARLQSIAAARLLGSKTPADPTRLEAMRRFCSACSSGTARSVPSP